MVQSNHAVIAKDVDVGRYVEWYLLPGLGINPYKPNVLPMLTEGPASSDNSGI
ncbi:hypothetical protein PIB30_099979 [Stylosanthes scabra]|uniref:Uncharacterized protein n=1 Tax=Stylosanthes scabra TaxID=79078 RepID=A0ABU6RXS6_9FABA|nr:hypothetical protein [Stylosanthes scabra]